MNKQQHTIDDLRVRARARKMSEAELVWSAEDAIEASRAAERLESAGCRLLKSAGFYRDEACEYRAELKRRGLAGDCPYCGQTMTAVEKMCVECFEAGARVGGGVA